MMVGIIIKEYSDVHRQPNYWTVRLDKENSGAGEKNKHVHIRQGGREIVLATCDAHKINGRESDFSGPELKELKQIARKYNNYCITIDEDLYSNNEVIENLKYLRDLLLNNYYNNIEEPLIAKQIKLNK